MSQYESPFEENLYQLRRDKLAQIAAIARAADPALTDSEAKYPNTFRFTHTLPELRALGGPLSAEDLAGMHIEAAIAGRVVAIRIQGKAGFAQLQQGGQRLQIYVRKDDVGSTPEQSEALFNLYKLLDLGDHIGVRGYLMRTRTGELTLHAAPTTLTGDESPLSNETPTVRVTPMPAALTLLTKAMLPLPDKYSGLGDIELRYRRRYLDLFTDTGDTAEPSATGASSQPSTPKNPVILSAARSAESKDPENANPATTANPSSTTNPTPSTNPVILSAARSAESKDPENANPATTANPFSTTNPAPSKNPVILSAARSAESKDPENANPATTANPISTTNPAPPSAALTRLPARDIFEKRAKILRSIRHFFDTRGYLEVETPMLHTIAGGAAARPFKTHHNALDIPLSLRIAPELYLKRLVVGGLDRVYEINRNFRNEGVSTQHNPEFTMLEFYQAYANYHDLMDLTQELITQVAQEVNGTTITSFPIHKGPRAGEIVEIDLSKWQKLSMREAIIKFWPLEATPPIMEDFSDRDVLASRFRSAYTSMAAARASAGDTGDAVWIDDASPSTSESRLRRRKAEIEVYFEGLAFVLEKRKDTFETGKIISQAFEALAEEHLTQPTIIYDFPLAVSPLSKIKPNEPDWVERFEFYIGGFEVGNAFSELNDPDDQLRRFEAQLKERDRGDDEAHAMDEDYVRALGYGLPPTAGEGIGIDRLTMILTGSRSIRDVILFPLMRPQTKPADLEEPQTHESAE